MINNLNSKDYFQLLFVILIFNLIPFMSINYLFPGTPLVALLFLILYSFKDNFSSLAQKLTWIFAGAGAIVLSQIVIGFLNIDLTFFSSNGLSLIFLVTLGGVSKKVIFENDWKTYVTFVIIWILDTIWYAVMNKQAHGLALRVYNGGSFESEIPSFNRFFNGLVYAIEICSILCMSKFQFKKTLLDDTQIKNKNELC